MTGVLIGIAAVWMFAGATTVAAASQPEEGVRPEIKVGRDGERRTVTLRAGALHVTQTLGPSRVDVWLALHDDQVRFAADLAGRVAVERRGEARGFSVRTATLADQAALNQLLVGSAALDAFDTLLESSWAQGSEAATVLKTTREVLRVLQNNEHAIATMAMAVTPTSGTPLLRPARQRLSPAQCWDTYSRDVIYFTYALQTCLSQVGAQWWNPLATAWCAYEYNLKSSLAGVWLLDCYGAWV
jgi:hypothetical protein